MPSSRKLCSYLLLLAAAGALACDEAAAPSTANVSVTAAPLSLPGVGDVVWDVEVVNSLDQVVWTRRLASSRFGDGAGAAAYVGPCDADAPATTVKLWVVGVYAAPVTATGSFAGGAPTGVEGTPLEVVSPTTAGPLTRTTTCVANADAQVRFDVAIMRPASQGFFDLAVAFDDIFCSAKLDCCDDRDDDGDCDGDLELLFDASEARAATIVLGFACTAGTNAAVDTELYLDALTLDCTSPSAATFAADLLLDPSGASGNQCAAGAMSSCDAVTAVGGVDPDTFLYQLGVYHGVGPITGGTASQVYWNVALGVNRPAIGACHLRARGTADDRAGSSFVDDGVIAAGVVYPVVTWDVALGACVEEQLTFGSDAAVGVDYADDGAAFAFGFGANRPAGAFCALACANGGVCVSGACACPAGTSGPLCEEVALATPANLTCEWTGPSALAFAWDAAPAPATGYVLTKGPDAATQASTVAVLTPQSVVDALDAAAAGGATYVLRATFGEHTSSGAELDDDQCEHLAPATPTGLAGNPGAAEALLSWDAVASTAAAPVDGYVVYRDGAELARPTAASFVDATALDDVTYSYTVASRGPGGESAQSSPVSVMPFGLPAAPSEVVLAASGLTLTADWQPIAHASSYTAVWRDGGAVVETQTGLTTPSATFVGLPAHDYVVEVSAVNVHGTSAATTSNTVLLVPAAPASAGVSAYDDATATVSWSEVTGATSYAVTGLGGGCTSTGTSCVVSGHGPNSAATLAVVAQNGGGDSPAFTFAWTSPPAAVTGASVTSLTHDAATLAWPAVAGAASYTITDLSGDPLVTGLSSAQGDLTGLTPATSYEVRVRATNGFGTSSLSGAFTFTTRPAAPATLAVTSYTNTSATLTWSAVAGATSYTISGLGTGCATSGTSCVVSGFATNLAASVSVTASNSSGAGPARTIAWTSPPAEVTSATPSAITQSSGTLSWAAIPGAASYGITAPNGNSIVTGLGAPSGNIPGLAAGTTHSFRVRATNTFGTSSLSTGTFAFTTVPPTPAAAPTFSAVTMSTATVTITPQTGATSYVVSGVGPGCTITSGTSCTISGLTAGATYSVTYSAHNGSGASAASPSGTLTMMSCSSTPLVYSSVTSSAQAAAIGAAYNACTRVTVHMWGGGGAGGGWDNTASPQYGGSGAGGAYATATYAYNHGTTTLAYSVGGGGATGADVFGGPGGEGTTMDGGRGGDRGGGGAPGGGGGGASTFWLDGAMVAVAGGGAGGSGREFTRTIATAATGGRSTGTASFTSGGNGENQVSGGGGGGGGGASGGAGGLANNGGLGGGTWLNTSVTIGSSTQAGQGGSTDTVGQTPGGAPGGTSSGFWGDDAGRGGGSAFPGAAAGKNGRVVLVFSL